MRETVDEFETNRRTERRSIDGAYGDGAVVLSVYSSRSVAVCLRLAALNVLRSFEEETQLLSPSWSSVLVGDDLLALTLSRMVPPTRAIPPRISARTDPNQPEPYEDSVPPHARRPCVVRVPRRL